MRAILAAAIAGLTILPSAAEAAAFASVRQSYIDIRLYYGRASDGIYYSGDELLAMGVSTSLGSQTVTTSKTVSGDGTSASSGSASAYAPGRFFAQAASTSQAFDNGHADGGVGVNAEFVITNGTGLDFDFFVFRTDWTPYNGGGPAIGGRVDDVGLDFAAFHSLLSGPRISSIVACNTNGLGTSFPVPPPGAACGLGSPDSSQTDVDIVDIDAGEHVSLSYFLGIHTEAISRHVPEPASLALLSIGLIALLSRRARR